MLRLIGDGAARTVGELAAQIPITVGAASKAVDRLEAAGWVERSPNPANRRSSLPGLSDDGWTLLEATRATAEPLLTRLMIDPLSGRAGAQLAQALDALRAAIDDTSGLGSRP